MNTFTIVPDGEFSLAAAAAFGFGPNSGRPTYRDAGMKLAFVTDDFTHHAGVALTQLDDGSIRGEVDSDGDITAIERQVARILSLDHSGAAWEAVGEVDPILGALQKRHSGLRPVLFHSPYEAAAWSIISARRHRSQGVVVRNRLSAALGRAFWTGPETLMAFPTPEKLLELRELDGLESIKIDRLHEVARAALAGDLDPSRLLGLPEGDALAAIQTLPGFGPFYATLVLMRATGASDVMTGFEPHLDEYLPHFYGISAPASAADVKAITDVWRPFRTWGTVLMRVAGEAEGMPARPTSAQASTRRKRA